MDKKILFGWKVQNRHKSPQKSPLIWSHSYAAVGKRFMDEKILFDWMMESSKLAHNQTTAEWHFHTTSYSKQNVPGWD